ncbi:hypothetical protein GCM10011502_14790 [Oceanisphaera marina]|uniref:Uncharacterized protein n=1 Tax=Oceanisphaera marina TaxID=2017550 RepID=A0ABQ1II39_9GAMM|nr:hypothetical protein GCM10011502_14790 [Oceanisphaera marina]
MAEPSMKGHIADRVTIIDKHIQIRQGTKKGARQCRAPHPNALAHYGHPDGGAQRHLRK